MTDPKSLEKMAKEIADKVVSDDYIEDGGYIKDWLYNDLLESLRVARCSGLEMAAKVVENPRYCGCKDPRVCETCSWILGERERCANDIRAKAKEIEK